MQYRWKLLLLFIFISVLPILIMRTAGVKMMRKLGNEFISKSRQYIIRDVETRVMILRDTYCRTLWGEKPRTIVATLKRQPELMEKVLPRSTEVFLACQPSEEGQDSPQPVEIFGPSMDMDVDDERPARRRQDPASIREAWTAFRAATIRDRDQLQYLPFKGRQSLWASAPINENCRLVFITPNVEITRPAHVVDAYVTDVIDDVLSISRVGLGILMLMLLVLAMAFSSRVTRALAVMEKGARRLAEGDFSARVDIRSRDEFGRMGRVFNLVGPRLAEYYRMQRSLNLAMEVQQNLLPKKAPTIPGLDIGGASLYCDETGGDYFDFLKGTENGRIAVAVGDVAGHGVSSALLMTTARALIRQRYAMGGALSDVVGDVNRRLTEDVEASGGFMTFYILSLVAGGRSLAWVSAGHDAAIRFDRRRNAFTELAGKGLPLGVSAATIYEEFHGKIDSGEIIVIGTDGIWETRNPEGEMFGKQRLEAVIRQEAGISAQGIAEAVIKAVENFRDTRPRADDITLAVVKIKENQGTQ